MNHSARSTAPRTSHIAAVDLVASSARSVQHAKSEAAVIRHPSHSSPHLLTLTGLDRRMLDRRLPERARAGRWRGTTAKCATDGKPACTWRPVAQAQNLKLAV